MKRLMYVAFGQRCTGQQDNLCVQDHLDCPLDIKRAGPAREVHVQHDVVVGSPGAKVVLNGSRLGCSRLSHKEAGPARPNSGAEQPCGAHHIHGGHQDLGEHTIYWRRVGLDLALPRLHGNTHSA